MNVFTYNIEGYNRNLFYLAQILQKYECFFLFVQEHWLPSYEAEQRFKNDFQSYNFHTTSSDMFLAPEDLLLKQGPTWHGTAIGWHRSFQQNIEKIPAVSERFCGVLYDDKVSNIKILAYSAYLPTCGQDDEFLETVSQLTADIQSHIEDKNSCCIIIGLDANQSEKSTLRRTNIFKLFLKDFSLQTILPGNKPTFHHNNQISESQIDHILYFIPAKSSLSLKFNTQLCKKENSDNLSSHDVIIGEIELPSNPSCVKEPDYSATYTNIQRRKPNWDESGMTNYHTQSAKMLKDMMEGCVEPLFIPVLSEMFSKILVISAEQNFHCSSPKQKQTEKKLPRFSKELMEAYNEHKRICKQWRAAGRPSSSSNQFKASKLESQQKLQKLSRAEQSCKAIKLHEELMDAHNTNIAVVCKKLKKSRGDDLKSTDIPYIETLAGKYSGNNVLEGFCSNTEILCNDEKDSDDFDDNFYKMCIEDNEAIFQLASNSDLKIPHMQLKDLEHILFKKLKLGKACDIFMLTVEHLRYSGEATLLLLVDLLNLIIDNLNYLSSPQLNTSVASIIHKGKDRTKTHHKSYRQVRVTVLIGRLIDEYIRPVFLRVARPLQNKNQYGFTEGISYLMGALQRHEAEQHCLDTKKTFFGCSLDGDSAFEVVNRSILTRELYMAGDHGDYWKATHFSYQSSQSRMKMNDQLSRPIAETLGVKQGHCRSSDHYTVYNGPVLDTIEDVCLGVWIGPINTGVTGVADDDFLMSDDPVKLQGLIDVADHYGKRYRITYGASKTKITISGSEIDRKFYRDTTPWIMGGDPIKVVEDNEHLGQVVSGDNQIQKNVDLRLKKGRGSLFSLLGPAFSYKCLLSPVVQLHLYRTFTCPIVRFRFHAVHT